MFPCLYWQALQGRLTSPRWLITLCVPCITCHNQATTGASAGQAPSRLAVRASARRGKWDWNKPAEVLGLRQRSSSSLPEVKALSPPGQVSKSEQETQAMHHTTTASKISKSKAAGKQRRLGAGLIRAGRHCAVAPCHQGAAEQPSLPRKRLNLTVASTSARTHKTT